MVLPSDRSALVPYAAGDSLRFRLREFDSGQALAEWIAEERQCHSELWLRPKRHQDPEWLADQAALARMFACKDAIQARALQAVEVEELARAGYSAWAPRLEAGEAEALAAAREEAGCEPMATTVESWIDGWSITRGDEILRLTRGDPDLDQDMLDERRPPWAGAAWQCSGSCSAERPRAEVRVYMPGDRIIRQTDEGKAVYILWVGSASIVQETEGVVDGRRTRSIAHLGTLVHGAVFGELAMLAQRHLHGVIASTVCCMWEVSFPMVREVLQGHPAERAAFLHMVEQHLDKLGNQQVGDCPLFADFSQHFRTFIGVNSEKHLYFAGQTIVQEGAFGDRFVIVNFGTPDRPRGGHGPAPPRASARRRPRRLRDAVQELELHQGEKYHVSVTAETMCQVFVVTRDAFQAALKKYPDMRDAARTLEAKEGTRGTPAARSGEPPDEAALAALPAPPLVHAGIV
ncbi:unnamed protein product [Prorocentrum cordatum]|uniref:Cyclic nucleotide-binding domain-containing protein n=1 Tax=Prorocentrum cordatum TaxID=2364126 RepID=A0ABN9VZQ7_9DINO|nr:unnamed protein product [Polarella glacialis]